MLEKILSVFEFFTHADISADTKLDTFKAVGGTSVGASASWFTGANIITFLTIVYLAGSIILLLPKYYREYQTWKNK